MNQKYPFVNPPLPYAYDALEPYIDAETMHLHHDAHLQTYVDNLNRTLADFPVLQQWTLTELIERLPLIPWEIRDAVRNNAGGIYNHIMYFSQMAPQGQRMPPGGKLAEMIDQRFGSFDAFKENFTTAALSVFGSGNAWLVTDRDGCLQIVTAKNQDNPLTGGLPPVLNIDVWEHAYYLKHHNRRADYIEDWFRCVNFAKAGERL